MAIEDGSDLITTDESQSASSAATESKQPRIDPEQLADKVYQLMREDLRLERARGQGIEWQRSLE